MQRKIIRGGCVALEGNGQRPSHIGNGWKETETMYTLNHTEVHAVAYGVVTKGNGDAFINKTHTSLSAGGGQAGQGYPCVVIGVDLYNQTETGSVSRTLNAVRSDADHVPCLCIATQQGGAEIMEDKCPTITASAGMSGNNQPCICIGENND